MRRQEGLFSSRIQHIVCGAATRCNSYSFPDPGHPEQPIRKRRTRPAGPAPGVFLWGFILRNSKPVSVGIGVILLPSRQSSTRSPLRRPIQRLNCVARRYLFRCLSASCFRRIRTAQSGQYFARLDFGVNAAPHTAHRFTLSRLWMISAYSAPSSGRTAARNHRHSNE